MPKIFADPLYRDCIQTATRSKGNERYGSLILKEGRVIGRGFNRAIAHPAFRLERVLKQGMANHSEVEALHDALMHLEDTQGADLYVAGFFPRTGQLFMHRTFTCVRCIPYLQEAGIENIFVPMPDGWKKRPMVAAAREATTFTNGTHSKRLDSVVGEYYLDSIGVTL